MDESVISCIYFDLDVSETFTAIQIIELKL